MHVYHYPVFYPIRRTKRPPYFENFARANGHCHLHTSEISFTNFSFKISSFYVKKLIHIIIENLKINFKNFKNKIQENLKTDKQKKENEFPCIPLKLL